MEPRNRRPASISSPSRTLRSWSACTFIAPKSPKEPDPTSSPHSASTGGTTAVRVDSDTSATVVDGYTDLSALLSDP
ncbi:hypothetical protein GS426_18870, partial [Rhodococcus hoagii]|nr:hypothetical protein [Prescottella equi]